MFSNYYGVKVKVRHSVYFVYTKETFPFLIYWRIYMFRYPLYLISAKSEYFWENCLFEKKYTFIIYIYTIFIYHKDLSVQIFD